LSDDAPVLMPGWPALSQPDQHVAWRGDRVPDDLAALINRVWAQSIAQGPGSRGRIRATWKPVFRVTNAARLHERSCANHKVRSSIRQAVPSEV